jgi:C-5 cytosine-specific DNA methylase
MSAQALSAIDLAGDGYERHGSLYLPQRRRGPLQAVDLFCGCGGFSLGMQHAGINVIAAAEWEPEAVISYLYNLGSTGGCAVSYVGGDSDRKRLETAVKKCRHPKGKSARGMVPLPENWVGANNRDRDGSGCRAMWPSDRRAVALVGRAPSDLRMIDPEVCAAMGVSFLAGAMFTVVVVVLLLRRMMR